MALILLSFSIVVGCRIFDISRKSCSHCLPLLSLLISDENVLTSYMLVHPDKESEVAFLTLLEVSLLGLNGGQNYTEGFGHVCDRLM